MYATALALPEHKSIILRAAKIAHVELKEVDHQVAQHLDVENISHGVAYLCDFSDKYGDKDPYPLKVVMNETLFNYFNKALLIATLTSHVANQSHENFIYN